MSGKLLYNANNYRQLGPEKTKTSQRSGGSGQSYGGVRHIMIDERAGRRAQYTPFNHVLVNALANATAGKLHLCATESDLPVLGKMIVPPIRLGMDESLSELRRLTRNYASELFVSQERLQDLETAVGEAATNAVVHGGGGTGSVYGVTGRKIQVCIQDRGHGISERDLPKATLILGFSTRDTLGHGLKMILQAVDRLYMLTGDAGTTLLLEQDIK